ncbi:MAG TPA: LysR family transcriptional regulator [Thermoanaerobaculia bacterium]|nr:LysR family transcriptional regulator [Thermoanaerobaculia bacterium]
MVRDDLSVLSAFLAVAEERSFTRAAKRLGVSPSALSHAIRGLEEQIGVRLLARTTRSVAPTDAGEQLIAHLRPALGDIRGALEQISGLRDRPAGRVRLVVPRLAARLVVAPKLAQFAREYPDVVLEVTTDDSPLDLVAGRFDAGIHLGEFIERDMIAVRVSRDHRPAVVGSPRYFESRPKPESPRDLARHRCINIRLGSAGVYRWEFDKGDESLTVAVDGPLNVDDVEISIRAAIDGVGLAFSLEEHVAPHLASGALVRVLEDWCPPFAGFFLYYPSRRQQPAALSALIETLRL